MSKPTKNISEAVELLKDVKKRKFLERVEVAVKLNLNTKKPDHNFKDLCILPHSLDKKVRILVVDDSLSKAEADALGVDYCGGKEMLDKIKEGWVDFDVFLTTAKMMPMISKLGKILGPRNLMPSPKLGTVVTDMKKSVAEFKKGKMSIKNDSFGNVHFVIGHRDFSNEKLIENFNFVMELIKTKKPKNLKGKYIEKIHLTTTMGPSFSIDVGSF